jgi:hypothetical protein
MCCINVGHLSADYLAQTNPSNTLAYSRTFGKIKVRVARKSRIYLCISGHPSHTSVQSLD